MGSTKVVEVSYSDTLSVLRQRASEVRIYVGVSHQHTGIVHKCSDLFYLVYSTLRSQVHILALCDFSVLLHSLGKLSDQFWYHVDTRPMPSLFKVFVSYV